MKMKYLFYALLTTVIGVTFFAFEAGFLKYLWYADVSKLSFVILALFARSLFHVGTLVHRDDHGYDWVKDEDLDLGYEHSELSMGLGMLGTVIGFIMMMTSFAGVDLSSVENIKELFTIATQGMSTALLTTAVGLASSLILRSVYFTLERNKSL